MVSVVKTSSERRPGSRSGALVALAVALFLLSGCVEWSEDPQGNLNSVGLPGVPLWQSNRPPAPITPMDMGFTPEEAAKLAPPVLVEPPTPPRNYRYRWYQAGQNHCEEDLQKLMQVRAQFGASGPAPFCTDHPTAPANSGTSGSGSFF